MTSSRSPSPSLRLPHVNSEVLATPFRNNYGESSVADKDSDQSLPTSRTSSNVSIESSTGSTSGSSRLSSSLPAMPKLLQDGWTLIRQNVRDDNLAAASNSLTSATPVNVVGAENELASYPGFAGDHGACAGAQSAPADVDAEVVREGASSVTTIVENPGHLARVPPLPTLPEEDAHRETNQTEIDSWHNEQCLLEPLVGLNSLLPRAAPMQAAVQSDLEKSLSIAKAARRRSTTEKTWELKRKSLYNGVWRQGKSIPKSQVSFTLPVHCKRQKDPQVSLWVVPCENEQSRSISVKGELFIRRVCSLYKWLVEYCQCSVRVCIKVFDSHTNRQLGTAKGEFTIEHSELNHDHRTRLVLRNVLDHEIFFYDTSITTFTFKAEVQLFEHEVTLGPAPGYICREQVHEDQEYVEIVPEDEVAVEVENQLT